MLMLFQVLGCDPSSPAKMVTFAHFGASNAFVTTGLVSRGLRVVDSSIVDVKIVGVPSGVC